MTRLLSVLTVAAIVLASPRAVAQKPSQSSVLCSQDGLPCRLWVPDAYSAAEKYPLVIYLHGAGQRGTDNLKQADEWNGGLTPFLSTTTRMQHRPFVMAPQCPGNDQWVNWPWTNGSYDLEKVPESAPLRKVRAILAAVRAQYSIDPDRIYVVGFSMGGYGAWDMLARTPELFAGGAPNAGGGAPGAAARMRSLAVWAAHNADDTAVPPGSDREMFRALAAAGGRPLYTEGASGGHGDGHRGGSALVQWLFAQRRGIAATAPAQLAFAPPGGTTPTPVTVSLTSNLAGAQLRYAIDGTVAGATTGKPYAAPFMVGTSAVVTAAAITGQGSGQVTVHHAQPYVIGATPPPDGAAPSTPPVESPDAARADTSPGPTTPRPASDGAVDGRGTDGGAEAGGSGGAGGTGDAGSTTTPANADGGKPRVRSGAGACAVAGTSLVDHPPWPLLAIGAAALLARRRRRATR